MPSGCSGAAAARLHLVEDEQQLVFVRELSQAAQKTIRWDPNAAFALDRLDEDRACLVINQAGDRV